MRSLALLAAGALAQAGCIEPQCNAVAESNVRFSYSWPEPDSGLLESMVTVCLNRVCSTGAFGPVGSATASIAQLDGDLGPVTAQHESDGNRADQVVLTIQINGGNGRYHDGDMWTIQISSRTTPVFITFPPATYASHDQPCSDGTYQTLSVTSGVAY